MAQTDHSGDSVTKHFGAKPNVTTDYRHQADVCHAYQVVHAHGVPDENIIVMMYDDIADNKDNPAKGTIINRPGGPDVYKGVPKDYTKEDVTADKFLEILQGKAQWIILPLFFFAS